MNLKDKLIKERELTKIDKKWEDMQAKMDVMEKRVTIGGAYVNLKMLGNSSFTQRVDESILHKRFNLPNMESYDRTADPIDHLEMFCTSMSIQRAGDAIMCKAFPATLKKAARSWFSSLPPRSISTFKDFGEKFVSHFISSIAHKKTFITLMSIRQRQDEP